MNPRFFSDSTVIARSPHDVYAMVADVTRMGEWSPICKECWWDGANVTGLGAWFTGRNINPERTWETHCEVVGAEPGREFAFVVSVNHVRWGYTFAPVDEGTQITESWDVGPASLEFYRAASATAEAFLEQIEQTARDGIAVTLAAIKARAESAD